VRWRLLAPRLPGSAETIAALGLGAAGARGHGERFALVAPDGAVVDLFDAADPAALDRLAQAARALSSTPARPMGGDGPSLFASLGCQGCHDRPAVAPPVAGLLGRTVRLADGSSVVADAPYLRQSILDPPAAVVDGYRPTMPSYRGLIDEPQLAALVRYMAP
jgi:mono/diheme cytochrome c family protein